MVNIINKVENMYNSEVVTNSTNKSLHILYPPKLKKWDNIRVIAPSRSLKLLWNDSINIALKNLQDFWFNISFWKNVNESDEFYSSSVKSRIDDLHEAFLDKNIQWIFTVIGWYNSNQLLDYIDYEIIKNNPKVLCGFSDITALSNAIFQKTWLVWYSWPHFSSWWMKKWFEYTKEYFEKCCIQEWPYDILPAKEWSDDPWYIDQENRDFILNEWYWIFNHWKAEGIIIGGHAFTFNSLFWTEYIPNIHKDLIIFYENNWEFNAQMFDKNLQTLIQQSWFKYVKWIIIGRFQKNVNINKKILEKIIKSKEKLQNIPIIWNIDFWHTTPFFTFPIGWYWIVDTTRKKVVNILKH